MSQNPNYYSFKQTASAAPNKEHGFYPYTDNGGSTLAIAGSDFTIVAGDTRSTSGYNINTRYAPKVFRVCGLHQNSNVNSANKLSDRRYQLKSR